MKGNEVMDHKSPIHPGALGSLPFHFCVGLFRHGKDVWIKTSIAVFVVTIRKDRILVVDRQFLIRIYCHQDDP